MKVVIVDDSVVFRMALKQALSSIEGLEVVSALSNGQLAVDYLKSNPDVDLITLDMEMPILDGMGVIVAIRKFNKTIPIIVFSSLTTKGAEKTIEALNHGANDFVTKEEVAGAKSIDHSVAMIKQRLVPKIQALYNIRKIKSKGAPEALKQSSAAVGGGRKINCIPDFLSKPKLIVMASSTGGPEALTQLFKSLSAGANNLPILLVQHMPPVFTTKLAEMLSRISPGYQVLEAKGGESLRCGVCYLAPGDFHMRINSQLQLTVDQEEKNCFVRPAANILFESVAKNFDQQVASFVLTGMGEDGGAGVVELSKKGSYNFYQSERTCTVFGMPAAIQRIGTGYEVDLIEIPKIINDINARI